MIYVPEIFQPKHPTIYPPNNNEDFEWWLKEHFKEDIRDMEYLPIMWTAYYCKNNYGQDHNSIQALQVFLDDLPRDKKYWTVIQYDDGILNNVRGLDLLQFNMSIKTGVEMPLICQPHPYSFSEGKKYLANFIGSKTHPIREYAERLKTKDGYYISFEPHTIEDYCRIISESIFTLAFRGYGANSFRTTEAMQYGSIPVYISDTFITTYGEDIDSYGVKIKAEDAGNIDKILSSISEIDIARKLINLPIYYNKYYTYEGNFELIKKHIGQS